MKYIVVEGCIGAGKTTVARILAEKHKSTLLLEKFEENPFLDKFYVNKSAYALETELCFALIHYHQLKDALQQKKHNSFITDFCIEKDTLFADMNLSKRELGLFYSVYRFLSNQLKPPELMVCLHCTDELIIERITHRNRNKEDVTWADYFIKLNHLYEHFFERGPWKRIDVDMNKMNFLQDPNESNINWLLDEITK